MTTETSVFLENSPYSSMSVKVHPVIVWSILDQYSRRPEGSSRVIGTLMGVNFDGLIEVRSCFPVPHRIVTRDDEATVLVDNDFYQNMLELHNKAHPKEVIIGWYATGSEISDHSVLIHHDFYAPQVTYPIVHLTVNTDLSEGSLGMKAYVSQALGLEAEKPLITTFLPVPFELTSFEAERVGIDAMMRARSNNGDSVSPLLGDLNSLQISLSKLVEMLDDVSKHVTKILNKEVPVDNKLGRFLTDAVAALPKLDGRQFESMFNGSLQDLLMAVYLANLTRAQLSLGERLQSL